MAKSDTVELDVNQFLALLEVAKERPAGMASVTDRDIADKTKVPLLYIRKAREFQALSEEQKEANLLLDRWTNDSGHNGWLFRDGALCGDKPSRDDFIKLIVDAMRMGSPYSLTGNHKTNNDAKA